MSVRNGWQMKTVICGSPLPLNILEALFSCGREDKEIIIAEAVAAIWPLPGKLDSWRTDCWCGRAVFCASSVFTTIASSKRSWALVRLVRFRRCSVGGADTSPLDEGSSISASADSAVWNRSILRKLDVHARQTLRAKKPKSFYCVDCKSSFFACAIQSDILDLAFCCPAA